MRLTVLDAQGQLVDHNGDPLLPQARRSHRRSPACDLGFGPACIAHCRATNLTRVVTERRPFLHTCWKGIREWCLPLILRDRCVGVVYAGSWRMPTQPAATSELPAGWPAAYRDLPPYDATHAEAVVTTCELALVGIAAKLDRAIPADATDRASVICIYLARHAALPVQLADLADHLGLSASRTGHLIQELFDIGFPALLRHQRLCRACHLLRHESDLTIADVAHGSGFADPKHFARCFKAALGVSPREWRASPSAAPLAPPERRS